MEPFDFTTARFIKPEGGQWTLDRDWDKHPPSPSELTVLYAHTLRLDRIVGAFIRHFSAGDIVAAEGLDEATTAALREFYAAAIEAMTPPAAEVG
jgi:hypothetical protein